jgi:hypothetical protein
MAGTNYGTVYEEVFAGSSAVSGSAPTSATDGQPLSGLGAITLAVSAPGGQTLGGAGTLDCYLYDPALIEEDGSGTITSGGNAHMLAYDGQVKTFVASTTVGGQTSGASANIASDDDNGATGTLYLTSVTGTFVDNEKLVRNGAVVNGTLSTNFFLDYDGQTGNFTVGQVVTGGTSGATGTIAADVDGGATGTLELTGITGTFADNETITDPVTGSAAANGTQYKTLAYDGQTVNFVVGEIVWGRTSGATGTIQKDTDGGATGTLGLKTITGTFTDNEALAVEHATANGAVDATGNSWQLDYDGQTGNFAIGEVVTGGTSGATATVILDTDAGATGTLKLTDVTAAFVNNEAITGDASGAAVVNGTLYTTFVVSDTVQFETGQTVTGATNGGTGTVTSFDGTTLVMSVDDADQFDDGEVLAGDTPASWARVPSGDFDVDTSGVRTLVLPPIDVVTPRGGRIKWIPTGVTFTGGGSGGVTVRQMGQAPGIVGIR